VARRPHSRAELDALLDQVEIDPVFPAFVAAARAAGVDLEVVSDGLDYAIERVLARHGLGGLVIASSALEQIGARSWRLGFPYADPSCRSGSGTCKCARAGGNAERDGAIVLIGDGRSDFCVAAAADLVLAKDSLAAHCRELALPHFEIGGFADALSLLPSLTTRFAASRHASALQGSPSDA